LKTRFTIKEWCQLTGWPLDEWMALEYIECAEILDLYGAELNFFKPVPKFKSVRAYAEHMLMLLVDATADVRRVDPQHAEELDDFIQSKAPWERRRKTPRG
jgi:hypothetical protein